MFLVILYLVISTLAEACNSGDASSNCGGANCEMVGETEICTQCNTDNVPINGRCETAADAIDKCTAEASGTAGSCKVCGVHVSESEYCSECNSPNTHAPVNGKCADVNTEGQDKTLCPAKDQGKCTRCGGNSLLYMGGCYQVGDGLPGKNLCLLSDGSGVCTEAAPGYFLNPLKASNKDSVVACSNTTGFTDAGKTYKGVDGCATCTAPEPISDSSSTKAATCTRCQGQKYLKGNTCVDGADACGQGYAAKKDDTNGNKCLACTDQSSGGVTGCAECTYDSAKTKLKCTKCSANYLKTAADGTTTCVDQDKCVTDSFPVMNAQTGNKCVLCGDATGSDGWKGVTGCAKCTKPASAGPATCTECQADRYLKAKAGSTAETCETKETCTGGYFPKDESSGGNKCASCSDTNNGGIADCSTCTPIASPTTTVLVKCSACESNKKVSPGGSSCVTNCPGNSSEQSGACVCSSGFAPSGDMCVPTGPNLSTGAIAGISVAAVVVVGGLVGFLCWWFICRGKA